MKVLITGGAGYIGSHTLVKILELNHQVCVIDNFINSSIDTLNRVKTITGKEFLSFKEDIRNFSGIKKIFNQFMPDIVIHFAGLKSVGDSVLNPLQYYENNVYGTVQILKAMEEAKCKKIIFSSSATVYDQRNDLPFKESGNLLPSNPYGQTKLFSERVITDWVKKDESFSAILLRYFNPVGAHESGLIGENPNGIPNNLVPYISQVAKGKLKKLSVFGNTYSTPDGTGLRDYIHISDLVLGHLTSLEFINNRRGTEIFNLGNGKAISVLEMIETFEKISGESIPYTIESKRNGDIAISYADINKAKNILGWTAKKSIINMCEDAWRWQKNI
tara:strand:+ start:317 stop:1312 length:996 start_codon:yes stop_codon:yes gene_type:complete